LICQLSRARNAPEIRLSDEFNYLEFSQLCYFPSVEKPLDNTFWAEQEARIS